MKDMLICILLFLLGSIVIYGMMDGLNFVNPVSVKSIVISTTTSVIAVLWLYFMVFKRHKVHKK